MIEIDSYIFTSTLYSYKVVYTALGKVLKPKVLVKTKK